MKKLITGIIIFLLAVTAGLAVLSTVIYNQNFNKRFEASEPIAGPDDFDGLKAERVEFESDKGQKLTGYFYSKETGNDKEELVIMSHGIGAGHNYYMPVADYFASKGYLTFAFDDTGCDESEGKGLGGLEQAVIDLDHAITFAEEKYPEKPIVLFGHSMGGYSVMNVLKYHPEVKAVAECSGFVKATDMFESEGKNQAGPLIYALLPFVKLYDRYLFGEYATADVFDAFEASETPVLVIHSADDEIVPIEYGLDKLQAKYGNDPRFEFIRYEDRGHNNIFTDLTNQDEINEEFREWISSRGYDTEAPENAERLKTDKLDFIHNVMDRKKWFDVIDEEFFEPVIRFYEENTGQ